MDERIDHSVDRHGPVWPLFLALLVFIGCILVAYAWFNVDVSRHSQTHSHLDLEGCWLLAGTNVPGYDFKPEPLSPQVLNDLGADQIINGTFIKDGNGLSVQVYLASWNSVKLGSVLHNPDWCWPAVGWQFVDLGQPKSWTIHLDGNVLAFECRVFRLGDSDRLEITVWCTLVQGRVFKESMDPGIGYDPFLKAYLRRLRDANTAFTIECFKSRKQVNRIGVPQQLVRLSLPTTRDWSLALQHLEDFISLWIKAASVQTDTSRTAIGPAD